MLQQDWTIANAINDRPERGNGVEAMFYEKEDKERILADLRESGMQLAVFAAQPGRPSRMSLIRWLRAEARGELQVPERKVRGRCESHGKWERWPEETIKEALRLAAQGMPNGDISRRLGIGSSSLVAAWPRKYAGGSTMSSSEGVGMAGKKARTAPRTELERQLADRDAQIEELEMRLDVARVMIADPKAGDPANLSNRQKIAYGERLRRELGWSLSKVLSSLTISKSSYFYALKAAARDDARAAEVDGRVARAFAASRGAYGYRRVRGSIATGADGRAPMRVSEREVLSSMRRLGLVPCSARAAGKFSSYAGELDGRPENVPLNRHKRHDFRASAPGRLLVTDVTEFKVGGGEKVYLSPVVDCYDGMPLSWSISRHPDSRLCDSSLLAALDSLPDGGRGAVVHTDGGSCYRSFSWKGICEERGVVRSMSRKANCGDNARAEGFFGTLKAEFFNWRDWSKVGAEDFMERLDEYLRWYRDERMKAFSGGGRTSYDTMNLNLPRFR